MRIADDPNRREVDVAFLIADLSGYTALTEVHGDTHAADAVIRYAEIARACLAPPTEIVERVGDEILFASPSARAVVETALRLLETVEREPLFPTIRAGVHFGAALRQGGKYFGATLNLTARVAAYARAGQVVATRGIVERLGEVGDIAPVGVFELRRRREAGTAQQTDPVCRMRIEPASAAARIRFAEREYFFCSLDCAQRFATSPDAYVA